MDGKEKLTLVEQAILDQLARVIIDTRPERNDKVQACLEALSQTDDISRQVAHLCMQHYIVETPPEKSLVRQWREGGSHVQQHAPGVFMAWGKLRSELLQTGDFIGTRALTQSAEALGFKRQQGRVACDFLYQWVAARYPDCKASDWVAKFGLRSGHMSHDIFKKGDFDTGAVIFHEAVAQDYVAAVLDDISSAHTDIDPIICLAVNDDWELATSMMSAGKRRRLNQDY